MRLNDLTREVVRSIVNLHRSGYFIREVAIARISAATGLQENAAAGLLDRLAAAEEDAA